MNEPWDPATPIEGLFRRIEQGSELARYGRAEMTEQKLISIATLAVQNTGLHTEDVKRWLKKPQVEHAWANCKTHFAEAAEFINKDITAQETGCHAANNAEFATDQQMQIAEALAQLAQATVADREALQANNASLVTVQQQLADERRRSNELQQQLTTLMATLGNTNQGNNQRNNGRQQQRQQAQTAPDGARITNNNNYCHTHGCQVGANHTSATCKNKAAGHQDAATATNKMNGSAKGSM